MTLRRAVARSFTTAVTLFGVAVVVFAVVRLAPGDPVAMMLGPGASETDAQALRALYGLDRSIPEQFGIWLGQVVQGDLGTSITARRSVSGLIFSRLPATLELSVLALLIALVLGGAAAAFGTLRRRGEAAVDVAGSLALSMPDFLWGLLLILLLGVIWPVFAISGRLSPGLEEAFASRFYLAEALLRLRFDLVGDLLRHMTLPALALGLPLAAVVAQSLKQGLKRTMTADYAMLARAKGFSEGAVLARDALRNALPPTLTLIGLQFTFVMGGAVIVERIFAYPGLGSLALEAVINRDLPLVQGVVLLFAALFVGVNLAVDALCAALNPRLRHG